jgi:hypothetical protein
VDGLASARLRPKRVMRFAFAIVLNPFERRLRPMRMLLA